MFQKFFNDVLNASALILKIPTLCTGDVFTYSVIHLRQNMLGWVQICVLWPDILDTAFCARLDGTPIFRLMLLKRH